MHSLRIISICQRCHLCDFS